MNMEKKTVTRNVEGPAIHYYIRDDMRGGRQGKGSLSLFLSLRVESFSSPV